MHRESLAQQTLIARSREIAAQYPRLGAAAQAAGRQQVQAATDAGSGLKGLGDTLRTIQGLAIAALGGSYVGSLIRDVNETAEAFTNVRDRIKLVTGEGAALESAFEGVQDIALRTNSELESTADLFARIVRAGKELGLSQEAALSLTETINQSIQLSGGSADSAKAAIIQLVQGLQSGVLRGEEFNSVMEQSPRLAQALADGLGKTTGELRELSKQGLLTTDVVINSLQGQAQAVQQEFDKLSDKPSRAIQNLSTAWTVYVGNVDKATGASKTAAEAINFLAENLDTIADLLIDAGQAGAAFVALRLAQSFLGIGVAAKTAAVQVAASTAAMNAAGAASLTAGAGVGKFAALLGGLKTFSLLGIVTNLQDIGTWIGESAAKLAGYKDLTEELAREERIAAEISRENARQKAALAQAIQLATEKARGLTPEARLLTSEFEKLRDGGKGVADALADISKNANLSDTAGIQAFSIAMRDLAVQGQASGDQIREAFANALKGEDLASFEVRAKAALSGARDEAELLATVLDASLREAIRRSGADFSVISGGMGEAARSAINDTELIINNLDRLSDQGVDTAAALTASIGKGIQTADSAAAVKSLREQVELVRKVLGDQVANTFLDQIGDKAKQVTSEVGSLSNALKRLGVTSDADLKTAAEASRKLYEQVRATGGSAREQGEAFRKMAADAIASGDTSALAFARAQAAIQGFEIATDSAGKTIVRAMNDAAHATRGAGRAADGAAGSYRNMEQSAEAAAAAAATAAKYSSPLGSDKYSAPKGGSVTGNTREERLAGQNAVDNTLAFELRDKLRAGALTADDADDIRAVIAALDQNEQINRDVDRMNPGAFSGAGMADRREWQNIRSQLAQQLTKTQVGRRVTFDLRTNDQSYGEVETDERGASSMEAFLNQLKRDKRRAS
nr:tape measure protein [Hydrogenophaga aromaticivorans]